MDFKRTNFKLKSIPWLFHEKHYQKVVHSQLYKFDIEVQRFKEGERFSRSAQRFYFFIKIIHSFLSDVSSCRLYTNYSSGGNEKFFV